MDDNRLQQFQAIFIGLSLLCVGYVSCLFLTYSFVVMPGLATVGDQAFVEAFQGLETRFQNADNFPNYKSVGYGNIPALISFPGAVICSTIALVLNRKMAYAKWIFLALVMFIVGMITTLIYNLPFNEAIFAAGDPSTIDVEQVRKAFDEKAWLRWNHFRAATSILAAAFLAWALYHRLTSEDYRKN